MLRKGENGYLEHERNISVALTSKDRKKSRNLSWSASAGIFSSKMAMLKLTSTYAHRVRGHVLDVEDLKIPVDRDVPVRIYGVVGI